MKPIVESQILVNLPIKNGSEVYRNWKDPPVHPVMFMKFFNLTNKDEFLRGKFLYISDDISYEGAQIIFLVV